MTIDNGFEDQWWNQGQRESTGLHRSLSAREPETTSAETVGMAITRDDSYQYPYHQRDMSDATIVSPISEFESPPPSYANLLRTSRAFRARPEELFLRL